jgi:ligand-binding sensor domain-containing protein
LTGYRYDETKAYLYYSANGGQTWTSIVGNLPDEAVNVIVQDAVNPNLLYAGTDEGAYISWDFGKNWQLLTQMPNVATYDLIVHPRENELVLATHGRSVYVLDAKPLQQLTPEALQKPLNIFAVSPIKHSKQWGKKQNVYTEIREPKCKILYYLKERAYMLDVEVYNEKGERIYVSIANLEKGFQVFDYNLKNEEGKYLEIGTYSLVLSGKDFKEKVELKITK